MGQVVYEFRQIIFQGGFTTGLEEWNNFLIIRRVCSDQAKIGTITCVIDCNPLQTTGHGLIFLF